MATYSKEKLSHSTNGKGISVVATTSAGTEIHTCTSATGNNWEEIWIYAQNIHTADEKLTIEWGGVTAAGDHIESTIATEAGLVLVVAGLLLQNSLIVKAFSASGNYINLFGYVNRITA